LLRIGTGWLGWTERDTLDTTMDGIVVAYESRIDMLKAIFGSSDGRPKTPTRPAGKGKLRQALRFLAGGKKN